MRRDRYCVTDSAAVGAASAHAAASVSQPAGRQRLDGMATCLLSMLRGVDRRRPRPTQPGCLNAHGFSLHAAVRCGAHQRKELERLCRTITRPAIANEGLQRNRAGQVVLQLKSPYRDGTTHIVMAPLEFMQRLAALVPRRRLHLIRFHGVLAPHARLRAAIVPSPAQQATEHAVDHAHAQGSSARRSWACLA